jgi:hypothetical protein
MREEEGILADEDGAVPRFYISGEVFDPGNEDHEAQLEWLGCQVEKGGTRDARLPGGLTLMDSTGKEWRLKDIYEVVEVVD